MTVWQQGFVLGGAVLLLAACDRATGPSSELQRRAPAAANLIIRVPTTTTTSDTTGTQELCRSGYSVSSGRIEMADTCIESLINNP